jgi:hypothetical protein
MSDMNDAWLVPGTDVSNSESMFGVGTVLPCDCAVILIMKLVRSIAAVISATDGAVKFAGRIFVNPIQEFSLGIILMVVPFGCRYSRA